jgi:hypothetical protein
MTQFAARNRASCCTMCLCHTGLLHVTVERMGMFSQWRLVCLFFRTVLPNMFRRWIPQGGIGRRHLQMWRARTAKYCQSNLNVKPLCQNLVTDQDLLSGTDNIIAWQMECGTDPNVGSNAKIQIVDTQMWDWRQQWKPQCGPTAGMMVGRESRWCNGIWQVVCK